VRRISDPAHAIYVRDPDVAQNLNMKAAKAECGGKRFTVAADADGIISFECEGKEMNRHERFKVASKEDWKRYAAHLNQ
jgi:hypothetical protein